jgi:phosphinothricin acetyltransferase
VNFRTEPQDAAQWRTEWRSRHAQLPWLVATDDDGTVAGLAYAGPWNPRPAYRWTVETTVYVAADRRGRGIGDALYGSLLDRLRRQGLHSALAVVALPNPASVRLHERHGYVVAGLLREAGFKLGEWRDVGLWQCLLTEDRSAPASLGPA